MPKKPRDERQKELRRISARAHYAANREKLSTYSREWHRAHSKAAARRKKLGLVRRTRAEWKVWMKEHPEYQAAVAKRYNSQRKNKDKNNARERAKCAKDPSYKLGKRLRLRVRTAIRMGMGVKKTSTLKLTGCDIEFLRGYLEARFKTGMKWSNYGSVWEIDHRIPCAKFDLTDESHQRSCFHYSNLQPLFVPDNRRKKDKLPPTHQAELL